MYRILLERVISGYISHIILEFTYEAEADRVYRNLVDTRPDISNGIRTIITKLY